MSEIIGWKLWYENGKTFSSIDGKFCDAPQDGIMAAVTYYSDGTRIKHYSDYYLMKDGELFGISEKHIERHLRDLLPNLKYGRWTKTEIFERIQKEVDAAKELS